MRPGMRWKYYLGGGFPVRCSLLRFSDIFSSSIWNESSDCPGGGGGTQGKFGLGCAAEAIKP